MEAAMSSATGADPSSELQHLPRLRRDAVEASVQALDQISQLALVALIRTLRGYLRRA